jgi:hypothetical protein
MLRAIRERSQWGSDKTMGLKMAEGRKTPAGEMTARVILGDQKFVNIGSTGRD